MTHALVLALALAAGPSADPRTLARLDTAGSTAELKVGAEGRLVIDIVATGTAEMPSHLELGAPTRVTLAAPAGIALAKEKLGKADAVKWEKKHVRFEIPFRATAPGAHAVTARVEFAVCGEDPRTGQTKICLLQADLGAAKNAWPATFTVTARD